MASGYTNSYTTRDVEFFGGPYDGHVQALASPPTPFICLNMSGPQPTWSRTMLDWLTWRKRPATKIAIYELEDGDVDCRYRYLGTRPRKAAK
ncbi:MAG: hypothetical protein KDA59_06325 [Planctomycetales bacterium]|nr:hypothetical protein [Planctomycetales bacterium]